MSSSYPSRSSRGIGILAAIPLLALAVSASALVARAAERAASPAPSHSTRDIGRPASTGLEPCQSGCSGPASVSSAPATAGTPASAPSGDGLSATGARTAPSAAPQVNTRGKASERDAAKRWFRRSDGRVVPPAPLEEPRRGGVGTLIGITFA
jgi:hypothetical protein